jgi:hypothetical protein
LLTFGCAGAELSSTIRGGRRMENSSAKAVRRIWALCLAIGTCTHVAELILSGGAYPGYPPATVIFWNALTVLDPLAAALLFWKPRLGVLATLAIMLGDVIHNTWAVAAHGAMIWPVALQAAFLAFVLVTAHLIWRDASSHAAQVR